MRTDLSLNSPVLLGILRAQRFVPLALFAVVLVATLGGARMLAAQAPATAGPAHKAVHPHKRPVVARAPSPAPQTVVAPVTPPAPEVPKWPANEKPAPATVTWDSQGLRIDATNSSLVQILAEVSTATGATVEGFDSDQRVFGVYGPGPARDVLSQLLQGSGYNVVLIGDQGQGTPRAILLSLRNAGSAKVAVTPATASEEDSDTDEQPQPGQPLIRTGIIPGRPQYTPQPGQPSSNPQN
jgi:hypothetical protein